ncbi:MAG: hypothetical protein AAGG07_02035 [Planctomycetota bacterium]
MTPISGDPLSALGSTLSPARVSGAPTPGGVVANASFADLLSRVRSGDAGSGLPVREARGSGLDLSNDQLERMAVAADLASAEGLSRAMVLMDGAAYELDVQLRTVVGRVEVSEGSPVTGFDGVIDGVVDAGAGGAVTIVSQTDSGPSISGARALADLASRAASVFAGK